MPGVLRTVSDWLKRGIELPGKEEDQIPKVPSLLDKEQAKALLENARTGFTRVHANFDAHEQKAARYVTVVTLIVSSANVALVPEVLKILRSSAVTIGSALLVGVTVAMVVAGAFAIVQMGRVLRVETVKSPPTDPKQLLAAFTMQPLTGSLVGEAWTLMQVTQAMEVLNTKRGELLDMAHVAMVFSIVLYGAALIVLFVIQLT